MLGPVLTLPPDLAEDIADLLHLADRGLRRYQQLLIHSLALFRLVLSDPSPQAMQRLESSPHSAHPRCKNRFKSGHLEGKSRDKSDTAAAAVVDRTQSEDWEEGCYGRWNAALFR